ncbi:MAG: DinB family protein [Acidobacteria bacterium]|nr:DinB family protein [Acidobacteriota bacterium]
MAELSQEMTRLVASASGVFRQMGVSDWTRTRAPGKWTRIEILGHLVDSAANNHQRFVRAIAEGDIEWPGYDQVAMVRVQQFGRANPVQIIALWESFNLFLARLIGLIPDERLGAKCSIGGHAPVTLEFLAADYVAHMQHHLRQIFEGMEADVRWVAGVDESGYRKA